MPYPPAPWRLHGQLWLSVFGVRAGAPAGRPAALYGVALVDYEPPSPLTYGELLVARRVGHRVQVTDIWVDSTDSRDGGRELWAIPKELGQLSRETRGGRVQRTRWSTYAQGQRILTATFGDVSRAAPRVPFRGATSQQRALGEQRAGAEVCAPFSGSARALPCRAHWDFDDRGPLAWLAGRRPLASFRLADFAMSFGGPTADN